MDQKKQMINIQKASFDAENQQITTQDNNVFDDGYLNSFGKENSDGISVITNNDAIFLTNISPDLTRILDKLDVTLSELITLSNTVVVQGAPLNPAVASNLTTIKNEISQLKNKLR